MKRAGSIFLLAVVTVVLAAGCATMASRWQDATSANTVAAYEAFLGRYPRGQFSDDARRRIDRLRFEQARVQDTIEAYRAYLAQYSRGAFVEEAKQRIERLDYDRARARDAIAVYEEFLERYAQGPLADQARLRLESLYFHKAEETATIAAYTGYLRRYPAGNHAGEARERLEGLYLQQAQQTNTVTAYEEFLGRYPQGASAAEARSALQRLKNQLLEIEEAARRVLPKEAKVEVTSVPQFPKKPQFLISAHLLEGHSADEASPYVRGDYGTHEKLTRLVRYRCARVLKSVVTGASLPDASEITIQARHGVRRSYFGNPFAGSDVAMTIYEISMSLDEIRKHEWSSIGEERVMELWKLDKNIIPSLQFQRVPF